MNVRSVIQYVKYPFLRLGTWDDKKRKFTTQVKISLENNVFDGLPLGWTELCSNLARDMRKLLKSKGLLKKYHFIKVFESNGSLHCHGNFSDRDIENLLSKYAEASLTVCPYCGQVTTRYCEKDKKYVCDDCRYKCSDSTRRVGWDDVPIRVVFTPEGSVTTSNAIDFYTIWNLNFNEVDDGR